MDYSLEEEGKTKGYRGFVKEEGTFKYPETDDAEKEVTENKELNTKKNILSDIQTDAISEGPSTDQKGIDKKNVGAFRYSKDRTEKKMNIRILIKKIMEL